MVGKGQQPSKRNSSSSRLWLRTVLLALLGALIFAAGARADVPLPEPPAPPTPVAEPPAPPVVEPPVETPPPPPVETPPPAPVVEPPAETPPPAPVIEGVPETPASEGAPATPSTPAVKEEASQSTPVEPPAETAARSSLPAAPAGSEAPPQVTDGLVGPQPGGTAGGNPGEVALITAAARASIGARAGMIAAQRVDGLSCQLSALVGSASCPSGSFAAQRLVAAPTVGSGIGGPPLNPTAARAPSDGDGGAAVGSRAPANPASGSAPGGASGGSAGGGGSGLGLSAFLTLAGLLLLAPLLAMRRLRLSCQPSLTACFVLIPERPG